MPHRTVVIVGAGPVGLVNALALARQGISVTVVERETDVFRSPRAMSYHWSALYGLDDLGLLEDMKRAGFLLFERNYHVRATGENIILSLDPLRGRVEHPYVLTLGQDQFAEIVIEHLRAYPHADVLWGAQVGSVTQSDRRVTLEASVGGERLSLTADWLIAADGAQSRIRGQLGLDFGGLTWPEKFIATNVRFDFTQMGLCETNYVIDPQYGAVVAKVRSDGLWRFTWSEDADLPESQLDERVATRYAAIFPPGAGVEPVSQALYRMHQRAAETMRVGRIVLAGDSAHATNPTSGFGLVGGLHDSYILSEALGAVIRGEAPDSILDRYSEDRLTAFWTVSSPVSTESMRLVFHSNDPDRLEVDMKMYRRIAADPGLLLNHWLQGKRIETPSVVSGRFQSAGRNDVAPAPAAIS